MAYTSRERAFMRALLHHDYNTHRNQIYSQCTAAWVVNPGAELVIVFDYSSADVAVVVRELTNWIPCAYHWLDMAARASASAGRISLNVMLLHGGDRLRDLVIPLRRTTSKVQERLKRIAAGMQSADLILIHERVKLLKPDVMSEIH